MKNNVIEMHASNHLANYIRVGFKNFRKIEDLHASGKLSSQRVIIDANYANSQIELLNTLRATGSDIVLDVKAAEASQIGTFESSVRHLPWANKDRLLELSDFSDSKIRQCVTKIAEFATEYKFSSVLSPSHFLDSARSEWRSIDIDLCCALHEALSELGSSEISIDYTLNTNMKVLSDESNRKALIRSLSNLPFENLWLRIGGFGNDASPAALRRYINSAWDFQNLNKPIVADHVGGFIGLSLLAFGAVGGIAHGVATKERFNTRSWTHKSKFTGGIKPRFYFHELDLFLSLDQANTLLSGRGVKSYLACLDSNCCRHGINNMKNNCDEHFMFQRSKQFNALSNTPSSRRVDYFLNNPLRNAIQMIRKTENVKLMDDKLKLKVSKHARRLERIESVLLDLHETNKIRERVLVPSRCKLLSTNNLIERL